MFQNTETDILDVVATRTKMTELSLHVSWKWSSHDKSSL